MKVLKKIYIAATALATVFATGCKQDRKSVV